MCARMWCVLYLDRILSVFVRQVISTLPRDQFLVLYQHVARQVTADELKRMGNGGG